MALALRYYSTKRLRLAIMSVRLTDATNISLSLIMRFHGDFAMSVILSIKPFFSFKFRICNCLGFVR
jgi:hypothetical protein